MNCGQCNSILSEHAKFCSECGAKARRIKIDEASITKTAAAKQYAMDVAQEAGELSKDALKSDLGKKMAAGAALGAVIAIPIPFVGPVVGAAVGAGIVAFRRLTK